jgi:hypothetical protein
MRTQRMKTKSQCDARGVEYLAVALASSATTDGNAAKYFQSADDIHFKSVGSQTDDQLAIIIIAACHSPDTIPCDMSYV